jgi:hypothetical protein
VRIGNDAQLDCQLSHQLAFIHRSERTQQPCGRTCELQFFAAADFGTELSGT